MIGSMSSDGWITLLVVALSLAFLVSNRFSPEIILVGALSTLLLAGVLDTTQALSGFANPGLVTVTVTVAVLYVVVAGLVDTGAVQAFGARLLGRPKSITGAQTRLMLPLSYAAIFGGCCTAWFLLPDYYPALAVARAYSALAPVRQ